MTRILSFLAFLVCIEAYSADPLPGLGADASDVTVSGLSSGGYMAVQLHVAHSAIVKGAGVIAGGPYYCAKGSVWTAYYYHNCTEPGGAVPVPPIELLHAEAEAQAKAGRVDATANLAGSHAWLFASRQDKIVSSDVVEALNGFYNSYKVKTAIVRDRPAGHGMPTLNAGNPDCAATKSPFINACGYDAAGELLKQLLGTLNPPAAAEGGRLLRFDQEEFSNHDAIAISMDGSGYAYVPQACEKESCRVHVALHGCRQNAAEVGERFVREAGYNRWADSNRLIVLYPQTIARNGWAFGSWSFVWNPRGCWDWWGYTGPRYHTKEEPQVKAVKAMLERLSAPRQ